MVPKLAHLFLVRSNLHQESLWKRFFRHQEGRYSVYVHAKWPDQIKSTWLRNKLIPLHCKTEWGRISIVQAELELLKLALQDCDNQFFLLHSESCVPIRSFEFVYRELFKMNQSWVSCHRNLVLRYQGVNQAAIRKEHFRKSSQFFCLTRAHAALVLDRLDLNNWKQCYCADEHCIATTLSEHDELSKCANRDLTFAYWPGSVSSPMTFHRLSYRDLSLLRRTAALFARKFAADSDIANYVPILQQSNLFLDVNSLKNVILFGVQGDACRSFDAVKL